MINFGVSPALIGDLTLKQIWLLHNDIKTGSSKELTEREIEIAKRSATLDSAEVIKRKAEAKKNRAMSQ